MITKHTKLAIRAFHKLWMQHSPDLAYAREMDAGFDGGEFSGPAHDNLEEEEYQRIVSIVAERFLIDPLYLNDKIDEAEYIEFEYFLESMRNSPEGCLNVGS